MSCIDSWMKLNRYTLFHPISLLQEETVYLNYVSRFWLRTKINISSAVAVHYVHMYLICIQVCVCRLRPLSVWLKSIRGLYTRPPVSFTSGFRIRVRFRHRRLVFKDEGPWEPLSGCKYGWRMARIWNQDIASVSHLRQATGVRGWTHALTQGPLFIARITINLSMDK